MNVNKNGKTFQTTEWGNFWASLEKGEWEPGIFTAMDQYLTPSSIVFDIGAWLGPITLYAAQICEWCYSVEPDFKAYLELQNNIKANCLQNVTLHNFAIMGYEGSVELGNDGNLGDSGTARASVHNRFSVPCITLTQLAKQHSVLKVDFLKIDVEGAEESILEDVEFFYKFRPILCLSIHEGLFLDKNKAYEVFGKVRGMYSQCFDLWGHELKITEWPSMVLMIP